MVPLMSLWIPIVLSAMIVFLASSVIHMFLTYHQGDFGQVPSEDAVPIGDLRVVLRMRSGKTVEKHVCTQAGEKVEVAFQVEEEPSENAANDEEP